MRAGLVAPALRRWRCYLWSFLPVGDPPVRFLILGQGRTGSTLLTNLLDSHPDVVCLGEILSRRRHGRIRHVEAYLRGAARRHHATRCFGFKVKPYELTDQGIDVGTFLRGMADAGWLLVHLERENVVRHAVSTVMRDLRGFPHVVRGSDAEADERDRQYVLSPQLVLDAARGRADQLRQERAAFAGLSHHLVSYERDLASEGSHQAVADRLFAALGVTPAPVSSRTSRLTNDDLSDKIENFGDLLAAVAETEFAGMLTR